MPVILLQLHIIVEIHLTFLAYKIFVTSEKMIYAEVEVELSMFLTLALAGGE